MISKVDPASRLGALVVYPESDPMMRYDNASRRVFDDRDGTYMTGQIIDTRAHVALFIFWSATGEASYLAEAKISKREKPGYGETTLYKIVFLCTDDRKTSIDESIFPVARIARFLNVYVPFAPRNAGNIVVIDNRVYYKQRANEERLRSGLLPK